MLLKGTDNMERGKIIWKEQRKAREITCQAHEKTTPDGWRGIFFLQLVSRYMQNVPW